MFAVLAISVAAGGLLAWIARGTGTFERPAAYVSQIGERDINLFRIQPYEEMKTAGFRPRKDLPPWPFSIPINWSANPFDDGNWQFQLHAWRMTDPMLDRYFATGDRRFLREAIAVAVDWETFRKTEGASRFTWYDMATGIRAMRLAFFLDAVFSGRIAVSADTLRTLFRSAEAHIRHLRRESELSLGNHGFFQAIGLDELCRVLEGQGRCEGAHAVAQEMFEKVFRHAFTDQGVHKEASPSYHFFTTEILRRLPVRGLADAGMAALLEKADRAGPWFVLPDGHVAPVGDSIGREAPLSGPVDLTCLGEAACYAVGDFVRSGYAVIRSDPAVKKQPSMLLVSAMAFGSVRGHKHADDLSFVLSEDGAPVFTDSGKYGYRSDAFRAYAESAAAHNTVGISGRRIAPSDIDWVGSELSSLSVVGGAFEITGTAKRPGLFTQQRTIRYIPARHLTVRDVLSSDDQWTYVSPLHFARNLHPQTTAHGFTVVTKKGRTIVGETDADCRVDVVRGERDPIDGWVTVGYQKMEPASVVRASCPGTNRTITWDIRLDAPDR